MRRRCSLTTTPGAAHSLPRVDVPGVCARVCAYMLLILTTIHKVHTLVGTETTLSFNRSRGEN